MITKSAKITTLLVETRFNDVRNVRGETMWTVSKNGIVLGFITQFKPEVGYIHPKKLFRGVGQGAIYLGAFYGNPGQSETDKMTKIVKTLAKSLNLGPVQINLGGVK